MSAGRQFAFALGGVWALMLVLDAWAIAEQPGLLRVSIPDDVSAADVRHAGPALRSRLLALARSQLAEQPGTDAVVVFVDAQGQPILPDLERARASEDRASFLGSTSLSFTYDSPGNPWAPAEITTLSGDLALFQPKVKAIYGDPFFNNTVNVRKDPSLGGSAYYSPTLNEIVLTDATRPAVTCHEMIHAFRDDFVIVVWSFEEGMTRATEIETFNQMAEYAHAAENHSDLKDIYYEGLARHALGSEGGNIFLSWSTPNLLMRFSAVFSDGASTATRRFTKDASHYFVMFPAGAGRTPDGAVAPGAPLEVSRLAGGDLLLSWKPSCLPDDLDFVVYEGAIGDYTSHQARRCSTAGATSVTLTPSVPDGYYLVAPRRSATEGSLGERTGSDRPPGSRVCLERQVDSCP